MQLLAQSEPCHYAASPQSAFTAKPSTYLVLCWCLSIAQYGYRYLLQVNDNRTSNNAYYSMTPWYLSILKFEILAALLLYGVYHALSRHTPRARDTGLIVAVSWAAFLSSAIILSVRLGVNTEAGIELIQTYIHFWPYFLLTGLLPLIVSPGQILPSLYRFSIVGFWLCLPYWMMTVSLYYALKRYPALSWPGHLRFGGILDDPNAYGVLMSFLAILALELRGPLWRFRSFSCVVMLLMTQSFSSYALLVFMTVFYIVDRLRPTRGSRWFRPVMGLLLLATALVLIFVAASAADDFVATELARIWRFKQTSVWVHLEYLKFPADLASADVFSWFFGSTGHSENVFNAVLLNFGVLGAFTYGTSLLVFFVSAVRTKSRWTRVMLVWVLAVVVDSAATPYLAVFPTNLLLWTLLTAIIIHNSAETGSIARDTTGLPDRLRLVRH